jgi:hypothetical protein
MRRSVDSSYWTRCYCSLLLQRCSRSLNFIVTADTNSHLNGGSGLLQRVFRLVVYAGRSLYSVHSQQCQMGRGIWYGSSWSLHNR